MAGTQRGPTPQFFVSDADKEAMVEQFIPQTLYALEHMVAEESPPLIDDLIDVIARAAAVIIAADRALQTPAKRRLGAETIAAHVLRHVNRYHTEEKETGIPPLERILDNFVVPDALRKAWGDN